MKKTTTIITALVLVIIGLLIYIVVLPGEPEFEKPTFAPEIEELQEKYFAEHGTYLRATDLAPFLASSTSSTTAQNIPEGTYINTYETPEGEEGYQVIYEDENYTYGVGYGPQAEELTWKKPKEATTTSDQATTTRQ